MTGPLLISGITCAAMIASILFFPRIKIGKLSLDSYWVITVLGALCLILHRYVTPGEIARELTSDTEINPVKILVLFLSMTVLSVFLDKIGFFSYLAVLTLKRARRGQRTLFLYLYLTVSVLTVFTSNDIIILTFTPFICHFAKNAKISPLPYLFAEFIAANTWSMALIIGNPTNIYLATANHIDFISYAEVMFLPTVISGTVAYFALLLIFRKQLKAPMTPFDGDATIKDRLMLWVGLAHLGLCTVLLAVSSYVNLPMWPVAFGFAVSLCLWVLVISLFRKKRPSELGECLASAPWQLIPFVLSMFVVILTLSDCGFTSSVNHWLSTDAPVFKYGAASCLSANIINNIPMSVLFSSVAAPLTDISRTPALFASIIGSNIGAFLTPIGALAGIMWSSILKRQGLKFNYVSFVKVGVPVAIPTLLAALGSLYIVLSIF